MSAFTMSLQEVIEFHGRNNLGLDQYPVISETHRTRINNKIIDYYLNQEIGQETVSLWRHAMRREMNQIMPVYNKLYATETLILDPLRTVDLRTLNTSNNEQTTDGKTESVSDATNSTESGTGSKSRNVASETPGVFLSGEGNYATNAADARSDATATGSGVQNEKNVTDTDATVTEVNVMESLTTGFQGSQAQLINDYRNTILNIDMMIVLDLRPLFMGVWNTGDSFFPNRRYY